MIGTYYGKKCHRSDTAQPIEPLVYFLSPCDSGEGYSNSVCPSVSGVPMIGYNQLVGVLNQALEPKNLFPINRIILLSLSIKV